MTLDNIVAAGALEVARFCLFTIKDGLLVVSDPSKSGYLIFPLDQPVFSGGSGQIVEHAICRSVKRNRSTLLKWNYLDIEYAIEPISSLN